MSDASALDRLAASRHLLLTTFRRDGTPVPTVVWAVRGGDRLLVITGARTGKVARIRRSPAVTVTACDARGRPHPAAAEVPATAELLDAAGDVRDVRRRIRARYGWRYLTATALLRVRGGRGAEVAIRLAAGASGPDREAAQAVPPSSPG